MVGLQLLAIPPRGHDIHQNVEHCIGCCKKHTGKKLNSSKRSLREWSHAELQSIVVAGARQYTDESWRANLRRLVQCLRVISTPVSVVIPVIKTSKKGRETVVQRRGTEGNYGYRSIS